MTRSAELERSTAETRIKLNLNLDGSGKAAISSSVELQHHMLNL
jgi:imidazoleglycerol phosphate dehydratase HisB